MASQIDGPTDTQAHFGLMVDERGHVLLTGVIAAEVDLGPEAEACTIMADFLAQRDFGE